MVVQTAKLLDNQYNSGVYHYSAINELVDGLVSLEIKDNPEKFRELSYDDLRTRFGINDTIPYSSVGVLSSLQSKIVNIVETSLEGKWFFRN